METDLPHRIDDLSCLFAEFGQLARKFDAVNLALGTPELDPPQFLKDKIVEALDKGPHQYVDPRGYAPLREAVSKHYSKYFTCLQRDLEPDTEIVSTAGGVAGIYCTIMSIIQNGDEVVTFEPFWPGILNMIKLAGGVLKTVPMNLVKDTENKTISWTYDWSAFAEAVGPKTKAIMLINPHSPTGKVFTKLEYEELELILKDKAPNAYIINDDVYDFCKFVEEDSFFANYSDYFNRSVTCFNGGKMFSCTGWKVGWVIGPKHLIKRIALMHETVVWNYNTLGQYAFSQCLAGEADKEYEGFETYHDYLRNTYQTVNKGIAELFIQSELPVYPALVDGGFSMTIEISECESLIPEKYFEDDYIDDDKILKKSFKDSKVPIDFAFCRWMACEVGLAMIPGSSLYKDETNARHDFVRINI